jgi:hypothetical protein
MSTVKYFFLANWDGFLSFCSLTTATYAVGGVKDYDRS